MNTSFRTISSFTPPILLKVIILISFTFQCFYLIAQTSVTSISKASSEQLIYECAHVGYTDGKPIGYSRDIFQDSIGNLWIACTDGLFVYDGKNMLNYHNRSQETFFPFSLTRNIIESTDRNLIISSDEPDIQIFNPYTRKVVNTLYSPVGASIYDIILADDGAIWAVTFNIYDKENGYLMKTDPLIADGLYGDSLTVIEKLSFDNWPQLANYKGKIHVGTAASVKSYHQDGTHYKTYDLNDADFIAKPMVFAKDKSGKLYVKSNHKIEAPTTSKGMFVLNDATDSFELFDGIDQDIGTNASFIKFIGDDLWVGGIYNTVRKVNLKTNKVEDYSEVLKELVPNQFYVLGIFEDKDQQIWVTGDKYLIKLTKKEKLLYSVDFSREDGFCEDMCHIQSIVADKQNLYFSYPKKLVKLDKETGTKSKIDFDLPYTNVAPGQEQFSDGGFSNLSMYEDKIIWQDQLIDLNTNTGIDLLKDNLDFRVANEIVNESQLWLAPFFVTDSTKMVYTYDLKKNSLSNISPQISLSPGYVPIKILESSYTDNVWMLTKDMGVFVFDKTGKFKKQYQLEQKRFRDIYEFDTDNLWLSNESGLTNIQISNDSIVDYPHTTSRYEGIESGINHLTLVGYGTHLWCVSVEGIYRFDIVNKSFDTPALPKALQKIRGSAGAQFVDDNKIYFGTRLGAYSFYPDSLALETDVDQLNFPLNISSYTLYNRQTEQETSNYNQDQKLTEITMTHQDLWFSLTYTLPDYNEPEAILYTHKLEGYDTDWSIPSLNNSVRYNRLPPGDYSLTLKASRRQNEGAQYERSINVIVKQAWYQSIWYYLFLAVSFAGIIAYIQRMRYIRKTKEREKMESLRTKISHDLHDEVGGLLTGLSMQSELLELKVDDAFKPQAAKIKELGREAVSQIRDTVWAIDASKDDVQSLYDRMKDFAELTLGAIEMPYNFDLDQEIESTAITPILRQQLYLIYKEAITNISKHSNGSFVNIILRHSKESTYMEIFDNGSIYKINSSGIGMSSMKKRAAEIQGTLDVDTTEGFSVKLNI